MSTIIYYYSATGNSLAIARKIADGLADATVVPLAGPRKGGTMGEAERVGIVFPIFAWGPPRTVEEFVAHADLSAARYIFAVASCGGTVARTLPKLGQTLKARGLSLDAGFAVRSESYAASSDDGGGNGMIKLVRSLSGGVAPAENVRLPEIVEAIKAGRRLKPERSALAGALLGSFFHSMAAAQFPKLDAGYSVAESCDGCGICQRVCPRGNVVVEDGSPRWHHDCDFCGACVVWCPRSAIVTKSGIAPAGKHHAEVKLADMLLR